MYISLVGVGYWGPNLARNLKCLNVLRSIHDLDVDKINKFKLDPAYSDLIFSSRWQDILSMQDVDGIVIATPPDTHYHIAKECLLAGKHVFVEKPMTLNTKDAEDLVRTAAFNKKILMVGHTFLYSPDICKMRDLVKSEDFGQIYYMYTKRLNLGKIQRPANVIEDLAPHDISIFNFITGSRCLEVQAFGTSYILGDSEDIAFINLKYGGGIIANLHLSWLDPLKVRETVVVGSKQMIYCDSGTKEIHVYNKGVDVDKRLKEFGDSYAKHLLTYRYGDELVPYIASVEPLYAEMEEFVNCIVNNTKPVSDGSSGLEVVKVLAAAQTSLRENGVWIKV